MSIHAPFWGFWGRLTPLCRDCRVCRSCCCCQLTTVHIMQLVTDGTQNLQASRFFRYFGGLLYVNAEAGSRQTSRCIHFRSSHPCIYTQILVPRSFNQTPLGCRSIDSYSPSSTAGTCLAHSLIMESYIYTSAIIIGVHGLIIRTSSTASASNRSICRAINLPPTPPTTSTPCPNRPDQSTHAQTDSLREDSDSGCQLFADIR